MRKPSVGTVTAYGRVRFSANYVGSISTDLQRAFARWLEEGVALAMDRGGMPWREAFQRSGPLAFTYRAPAKAKTTSLLLGVLAPSEDQYGRPFPFCVVTEMRESAYVAGAGALPVAAERFIAEASEVCSLARTASFPAVLAEAERRAAPSFGECAQAAQDLQDWALQHDVLEKLWASLFPGEGVEGAFRAFRVLVETVVPMKTHGAIGTCRSLRLPLGRGGAAATAFWVEVVRALAGWTRTFPAAFWPADRADGEALVCLEELAPTTFTQLWAMRLPDPLVIDVTSEPASGVEEHGKALSEIGRLLKSPRTRLYDLLDALARADAIDASR